MIITKADIHAAKSICPGYGECVFAEFSENGTCVQKEADCQVVGFIANEMQPERALIRRLKAALLLTKKYETDYTPLKYTIAAGETEEESRQNVKGQITVGMIVDEVLKQVEEAGI